MNKKLNFFLSGVALSVLLSLSAETASAQSRGTSHVSGGVFLPQGPLPRGFGGSKPAPFVPTSEACTQGGECQYLDQYDEFNKAFMDAQKVYKDAVNNASQDLLKNNIVYQDHQKQIEADQADIKIRAAKMHDIQNEILKLKRQYAGFSSQQQSKTKAMNSLQMQQTQLIDTQVSKEKKSMIEARDKLNHFTRTSHISQTRVKSCKSVCSK